MQREAAAQRGERAAGMENDGVRLRDVLRDFDDGAVADGDEDDVAGRSEVLDGFAACGDAGQRPADAAPGACKRPGCSSVADDAELHGVSVKGTVHAELAERRSRLREMRWTLLILAIAINADAK